MLSGEVLSQWLQRRTGTLVQGSRISLGPQGLRISQTVDSAPVVVQLPVMNGRQAAVARVQDQAGAEHALRVQAVTSHAEHAYQVERLVAMTRVVTAAREHPQVYPAVLAVRESFVVKVPAAQVPVPSTGGGEYELWCDVMAWCPDDLNSWKRAVGPMVPPQVVVPLFVPVLATVAAVHEHLGIVHRDITTNNILLDAGGRLLLGDWGSRTAWRRATSCLPSPGSRCHHRCSPVTCRPAGTPTRGTWGACCHGCSPARPPGPSTGPGGCPVGWLPPVTWCARSSPGCAPLTRASA